MAWSVLQSNNEITNVNTITFTTANLSAGSTMVLAISGDTAIAVTSVQDGHGNSFVLVSNPVHDSSSATGSTLVYALNTPAVDVGTKPTITVTLSSTPATISMVIQEVAGLATGSTLAALCDGTPGTSAGAASTTTLPSYASTAANEFLFYAYGNDGPSITETPPAGYTADPKNINGTGGSDCSVAYKNSTGGTETGVWTQTGAANWSLVLVAFRLANPQPAVMKYKPVTRNFRSRRILGPWTPHMAPPTVSATVPVSDSDSFSASEAQAITATLSDADTATGTDAASPPNATLSSSDTSSGADSGERIGVSASDTGSAAEAGSSTATLSGSDTGSASEGGTIGVSAADTATETENQLVSVQITDSDSFSGSDATGTLTVQTSDSASATEAGTTAASLSSSDSGSASDGGTINVSGSDSGSASDSAGPPNATLSSSDTGSASETGVINVSGSDTGTAAEAQSIAATLSSSDTGSASDGNETIRLTSSDTGSGSEGQGSSASFSTADTASAAETQGLTASLSSADAASAAESQAVTAHLSDADTSSAVDGGEGGTGGTHVTDTDSWHGEDSGFTFLSDSDTASASDGNELIHPLAFETVTATDTHTIAWVRSADTATGDDELKTLTGPAVSDSDTATATEVVKPFPFSDTDSFAMADNYVLDVWSGMAPYTYLGGRERRIHGPDGRVVATTDHVDPQFLRLAQKIAEASTVEWVSDTDSFGAGEDDFTHDWTVSVSLAPAVRVTVELG